MPTLTEVQEQIRALYFSTPKERAINGLPATDREAKLHIAMAIMKHLLERGKALSEGNLGYLLLEGTAMFHTTTP